jgi:hypothetical protein
LDGSGNLYVVEEAHNLIRKVTPSGDVTTISASVGLCGTTSGNASDLSFIAPKGIAVDAAGNLYIADRIDNVVRRITPAGDTSVVAGAVGMPGDADGSASSARFENPFAITLDQAGNIFVAESEDANRIRKISPSGSVSTVAGMQGFGDIVDGPGLSARFFDPSALTVDAAGNIFVADSGHGVIRRITPAGTVSTVAGTPLLYGYPQGNSDGVGNQAIFSSFGGIAVSPSGILYVTSGSTVRQGLLAGLPLITTQPKNTSVAPGGSLTLSVAATAVPAASFQWHFKGNVVTGATSDTLSITNASGTNAGDYSVIVSNSLGQVESNHVTVTVTSAPASGSGGGTQSSGGGECEGWFALAWIALLVARRSRGSARASGF